MTWQLLGHQWAVKLLHNHIVKENIRHAYLFTGALGVGRRTLALRFAQAINCPQPKAPGIPCGECRTCLRIERMQHVDMTVIEAEKAGGTIKIDQIRSLQHNLALSPYEAKYRIALLLRFDEANANASNALLKILEEPPEKVIILMTAETPESLLPTIVSRCEVLRLRPLSPTDLQTGLTEKYSIPEDQANLLAHIAQGRPGAALNLFNDPANLEKRRNWFELHQQLLKSDIPSRFKFIKEHYSKNKSSFRNDFSDTLKAWQSLWRDVMLLKTTGSETITNIDFVDTIKEIASQTGVRQTAKVIALIDRSIKLLGQSANARLTMEVFMLDLPVLSGSMVETAG